MQPSQPRFLMHRSAVAAVSLVALMSIASCGSSGDQTLVGELTDLSRPFTVVGWRDWPMNELDVLSGLVGYSADGWAGDGGVVAVMVVGVEPVGKCGGAFGF